MLYGEEKQAVPGTLARIIAADNTLAKTLLNFILSSPFLCIVFLNLILLVLPSLSAALSHVRFHTGGSLFSFFPPASYKIFTYGKC